VVLGKRFARPLLQIKNKDMKVLKIILLISNAGLLAFILFLGYIFSADLRKIVNTYFENRIWKK
jgi:hypothetical protein